jgi:hypothetical protein
MQELPDIAYINSAEPVQFIPFINGIKCLTAKKKKSLAPGTKKNLSCPALTHAVTYYTTFTSYRINISGQSMMTIRLWSWIFIQQ